MKHPYTLLRCLAGTVRACAQEGLGPGAKAWLGCRLRALAACVLLAGPVLHGMDAWAAQPAGSAPPADRQETFAYGHFGSTTVYRPAGTPNAVVLFVSGDGGWNRGVVAMARHLVDSGAIVVGIDIRNYRKAVNASPGSCTNYAAEFEQLAHAVQLRLRQPTYMLPQIVGYSSGATLAYAVAVQSPRGTWAGVTSLGFCPDIDLLQAPCTLNGLAFTYQRAAHRTAADGRTPAITGVVFAPATRNPTPWVAFQGDIDQVCNPAATRAFVLATRAAELVWLPKVGHGYSVESRWLPQFLATYRKFAARAVPRRPSPPAVDELPLIELPAAALPPAADDAHDVFAVLLTGDGGWAGLDQDVAQGLVARGVPVVALDSLKYFWAAHPPNDVAADLARILERYSQHFRRGRAVVIGYSFGADVLPFAFNRLPAAARARVHSVALLGLSTSATFEFHLADWITNSSVEAFPTLPELDAMHGVAVTCLYGSEDVDSACAQARSPWVSAERLPGGHHFDGDYDALVTRILAPAGGGNALGAVPRAQAQAQVSRRAQARPWPARLQGARRTT